MQVVTMLSPPSPPGTSEGRQHVQYRLLIV